MTQFTGAAPPSPPDQHASTTSTPQGTVAECRLPGLCDGTTHRYDHCTARLADITVGGLLLQLDLERDLPVEGSKTREHPHLQAWFAETDANGAPTLDQAGATITSPADAHALADALVTFAGQVRRAGDTLTQTDPAEPAPGRPFFTLDLIEDGEGGHLLCLNVDDTVDLDMAENTRAVARQAARLTATLAAFADLQQIIRDNQLQLVTLNPATAPEDLQGLLCLLYDDTDGATTLVLPEDQDPHTAVAAVRNALAEHKRRQA